jgi:hypothetical protein
VFFRLLEAAFEGRDAKELAILCLEFVLTKLVASRNHGRERLLRFDRVTRQVVFVDLSLTRFITNEFGNRVAEVTELRQLHAFLDVELVLQHEYLMLGHFPLGDIALEMCQGSNTGGEGQACNHDEG